MSINRKKLDKIISKALNETLEEKASKLVSKLKEGELAGEHPLFGKLNFATMSKKEKEDLMDKFYGRKKKDDDWREIEVGSDDEDSFEDEEEFYDEEDESVEMEEGFDSMELKNFRKRKDFDPEEFEDIPLGDVGFDEEMMDDDTGVDLPRRFTNDFKRAIKHRRDMEDEYGDEEFTEGKEGMCEQCGSTMKEGECEECGYKMEGIYDVDDIDNKSNEFDYVEEEMNEEDDNIRKDDSGEGRMEKFCNTESPDYDQDACDYHKKQGGAEMTEKLHGGQKKLDKNKNGRIDAADFKMLRAMKGKKTETDEEVEEGNAFTGALAKAKKEGKDEFEVDGKKYNVKESRKKESITLTEEQMIDLIERVVKEQKLKSTGKPRGLQKYQQAHEKSGKENKDNLTAVGKKMKDYLKDGSKGDFDMEPKKFPMSNGEMAKMEKKVYKISDAGKDFIDSYQRPGMENLDYDEIHPNEDWMKDTIEGSSRTGNNPKWANAVETEVNEKINKKRKENKFAKAKRAAYQKSAQPVVSDKTGSEDGTGINLKLESEAPKETKKLNEEFGRMKNLIDYNRKTQ